jgi:hypothetical protein
MVNNLGIGIQNGISSARKKLTMLTRFVTRVFPGVEKELKRWQEVICTAGDPGTMLSTMIPDFLQIFTLLAPSFLTIII